MKVKRILVFAEDEARAHLYGLKKYQIHENNEVEIFYWSFGREEGLILREGDWVQIIQQFGEVDAARCVNLLVRGALQQHFILRVMELNVFEVTKTSVAR